MFGCFQLQTSVEQDNNNLVTPQFRHGAVSPKSTNSEQQVIFIIINILINNNSIDDLN